MAEEEWTRNPASSVVWKSEVQLGRSYEEQLYTDKQTDLNYQVQWQSQVPQGKDQSLRL